MLNTASLKAGLERIEVICGYRNELRNDYITSPASQACRVNGKSDKVKIAVNLQSAGAGKINLTYPVREKNGKI